MKKMQIGIIGCGDICSAYVKGLRNFDFLELIACADLLPEKSKEIGEEFGLQAMSVDELLASKEIQLVVNLTVPKAHFEVSMKIIQAGKHVYSEKTLCITTEEAKQLLDAGEKAGIQIGCAPDTFLGGAHQTARALLDDQRIGRPLAGTFFLMEHGPEDWHPNPAFFYDKGAGPLFDMGPYYLTALVNLLGPIEKVIGHAAITSSERVIATGPNEGKSIPVKTPSHITGTLIFENQTIITMATSFDTWKHKHSHIELYGTEGSLVLPDPNEFGGNVEISKRDEDWKTVPIQHGYTADNYRGIGVADLALSILEGRAARANVQVASHILEVMESILKSSTEGQPIVIQSTCERPQALAPRLAVGQLDPSEPRIGIQLYTLREHGDFEQQLSLTQDLGFRYVESVGTHELTPEEMQKTLAKHQLRLASSHFDLVELEKDVESIARFLKANECHNIVMPYLEEEDRPTTAEGWKSLGRKLNEYGKYFQSQGLQLYYHNHDFEMVEVEGKLALDWLFGESQPSVLRWEADLAWVTRGGENPINLMERYKDRIAMLHVKDLAKEGEHLEEGGWTVLGKGVVDWESLIQKAKDLEIKTFFVEHDYPLDHREVGQAGYQFLKTRLG